LTVKKSIRDARPYRIQIGVGRHILTAEDPLKTTYGSLSY
jgi:hypothetical protein